MIAKACPCPGCGAARAHDECPNQIYNRERARGAALIRGRNRPERSRVCSASRRSVPWQTFIASAALRRAREMGFYFAWK